MDIRILKADEMQEIKDFCILIDDYGHIFEYSAEKLDAPFKKILEGIKEIIDMMNDSYEI